VSKASQGKKIQKLAARRAKRKLPASGSNEKSAQPTEVQPETATESPPDPATDEGIDDAVANSPG
jgi:hypothetical protein